jgi:hypothetical protein
VHLPILSDIHKLVAHINKLPILNRVFGYLILLIGAVLGLASLVFCLFMIWSLITTILDGSLFDNAPADEWDIR